MALHAQLLSLWLTGVLVRVSDSVRCADKVADPVLPCGLLVCWYVCLIPCVVLIKLLTPFYLVAYWCAGTCV